MKLGTCKLLLLPDSQLGPGWLQAGQLKRASNQEREDSQMCVIMKGSWLGGHEGRMEAGKPTSSTTACQLFHFLALSMISTNI